MRRGDTRHGLNENVFDFRFAFRHAKLTINAQYVLCISSSRPTTVLGYRASSRQVIQRDPIESTSLKLEVTVSDLSRIDEIF